MYPGLQANPKQTARDLLRMRHRKISLQGVARLHLKDVPTSNFSGVQNLYIQSGSVEVENIESEFGGASRDRKARDSENRQVIDFVENPTMPDYNSDAINSAHHHR